MKGLALRAALPVDLAGLARLWHETKQVAYPYLPLEQGRSLAEDEDFFRAEIARVCELWVADAAGELLGFLALEGDCLDRLYVHPSSQGRGVGSALLVLAQRERPEGFYLYTHLANLEARAFYESRGLLEVARGVSPPPESLPDIRYRWDPAEETSASSASALCAASTRSGLTSA